MLQRHVFDFQTLGDQTLGMMSWIMPVLVAASAFGGLSVHIMTSSRMCFVGARNGHFPEMLSHINLNRFAPTPALVFLVGIEFFSFGKKNRKEIILNADFFNHFVCFFFFIVFTFSGNVVHHRRRSTHHVL